VIGYLSASIEWAQLSDQTQVWHKWWYDSEARSYYFIGKDNIPFHAVIWPGQLIGAGEWFAKIFEEKEGDPLRLPYNIPANEFMNLEGNKISGSRNWAVWGLDFLDRYDPDTLRYYLTANMPESKDTDWDWQDFLNRNNNELVATWGNLANRVLSFSYKHWEGEVPTPGELRSTDQEIINTVEQGFQTIGEHIDAVHLRAGLIEAMRLAGEVNKYLDQSAPWFEIKTDKSAAGTTIYTALKAIDSLKVLLAPYLPHSSEQLHQYLGYEDPLFGEQYTETVTDNLGEHKVLRYNPDGATGSWEPSQLPAGQKLHQPAPLFRKLDDEIVATERARLGQD
jgi:methionyl-tRNA synthetase